MLLCTEVALLLFVTSVSSVLCSSKPRTMTDCRYFYNTSDGRIISPNFPNEYPSYTQCDYFIRPHVSNRFVIKLQARHFDLEGGYDKIEVREMGPHGRLIGQFSGRLMPVLYASSYWLRFTSDYSISKTGFEFEWSASSTGVRLVNGSNPMEGRVEIFYNATWGTICDDAWSSVDAVVACRMFGLKETSATPFGLATHGKGHGKIWLDNMGCRGNESSLYTCPVSTDWGEHNCNHGEDAGVRCPDSYELASRYQAKHRSFPKGCGGHYYNTSGQLMSPHFPLYPNFAQCEYHITPESSSKIMRLEFHSFDLENGTDFLEIREDGPKGPLLGRFTGNRLPPVFFAKRFWLWFTSDDSRAGTGFQAEWFGVNAGIRLRNGTWFGEGRVEIFNLNTWGTACDDLWDNKEAVVICAMLGYSGRNAVAVTSGHFGYGQGQILLDDVSCLGNETNFLDCEHAGYNIHNCHHNEDAGVICAKNVMDYGIASPTILDNFTVDSSMNAITIDCGPMKLTVTADMLILNSLFPFLVEDNQFLSLASENCRGTPQGNGSYLVFQYDITDCGMITTETDDSMIYHNKIVSHPNTSINEVGTFRVGQTLAIPLECSLSKTVILENRLKSFKTIVQGEAIKGSGNFSATMEFYKDPAFVKMIYDYPAYVQLGQKLGVEIVLETNMNDLKLVMQNCWATSTTDPTQNSTDYYLIRNRCPEDPTTTFKETDSNNKFRFLFKTFEYIRQQNEVYIICNLLVCNETDQSATCTNDCRDMRRQVRSIHQSQSDIQVLQGPLVYQATTQKLKSPLLPILAVAVPAIVITMIIITVIVMRSRKRTGKFSPPFSEYETKYETVAMLALD